MKNTVNNLLRLTAACEEKQRAFKDKSWEDAYAKASEYDFDWIICNYLREFMPGDSQEIYNMCSNAYLYGDVCNKDEIDYSRPMATSTRCKEAMRKTFPIGVLQRASKKFITTESCLR